MEYYSTGIQNGILTHAVTWINLKNMLSERSQSQKTTYCTILFAGNVQNRAVKRLEPENGLVFA